LFTAAPFHNRHLYSNQLTALEVGLFDENTKLIELYVSGGIKAAIVGRSA
jgi:hypothetical protein